jgi:hypothetical protein
MLYALCFFTVRQWATMTAMAKIAKTQTSTPGTDPPTVATKQPPPAAPPPPLPPEDALCVAGLMPRDCALSAPPLSTELTA